MSIIDKILRAGEGRMLRKLDRLASQVDAMQEDFEALTDEELQAKTQEFKDRLEEGETLDDILVEAFATVREASWRILRMRPFHVQVMGGIALHQGKIAEMKTGEGKTLVATMPSYLRALTGKGVHVVTVNDYLAKYQSDLMSRRLQLPGHDVRLHPRGPDACRAPRDVRLRHHLWHEQRVRLRLPARQHGAGPRGYGPARPRFRHCR